MIGRKAGKVTQDPFGLFIRSKRRLLNLGQQELANRMSEKGQKVSQATISAWERGRQLPDDHKRINVLFETLELTEEECQSANELLSDLNQADRGRDQLSEALMSEGLTAEEWNQLSRKQRTDSTPLDRAIASRLIKRMIQVLREESDLLMGPTDTI